jgi:hypothetical protein
MDKVIGLIPFGLSIAVAVKQYKDYVRLNNEDIERGKIELKKLERITDDLIAKNIPKEKILDEMVYQVDGIVSDYRLNQEDKQNARKIIEHKLQ